MCHLISAAPKCKEIVYGEFKEENRERINQWLRKDPLAFNWQHFFSYVVGTLEGGTEVNIEERKKLLRNIVKTVVPCDIIQEDPVEDKGPHDIVTSATCLEYIGLFLMVAHENVHSWVHADTKIL